MKEILPKKPKKSRFGKLRRPDDYVSVINRIQGKGLVPKKRSRSRSVGYRRHSMKKKKSRFGPGLQEEAELVEKRAKLERMSHQKGIDLTD